MSVTSINPATGSPAATYNETTPEQVQAAIANADQAFREWRTTSFATRAARMHEAANVLRTGAWDYARLMAIEMGKPIRDGMAEAEKCATACDFFADAAEAFLAKEEVKTSALRSFVTFQPLGVVLAIMPWNFPLWQVFRFAAPALMAGNAAVLKHASNVPGCALAIAEIFRQAGFPPHLFATLLVDSGQVDTLIEHPLVRAVTLTGSVEAGRAVARRAGEMLKKTVLELGGSDAYLVLEDADIESAAAIGAKGRLVNSGQSCIAAKRFIVVDSVRARFEERFVERMRQVRVGDPMSESTEVGPLARANLRDTLHAQVRASVRKGARCLLGGSLPAGPGAYYPPTVLTDVRPGMPAHDEELFGPVAAIVPVKDEAAAIEAANNSMFGLGGGIFSRDLDHAERLAVDAIEAGSVFVNATVQSDPKLPFGGVKASGYGRELSHFGIREFVNVKTIVVQGANAPDSAESDTQSGHTE